MRRHPATWVFVPHQCSSRQVTVYGLGLSQDGAWTFSHYRDPPARCEGSVGGFLIEIAWVWWSRVTHAFVILCGQGRGAMCRSRPQIPGRVGYYQRASRSRAAENPVDVTRGHGRRCTMARSIHARGFTVRCMCGAEPRRWLWPWNIPYPGFIPACSHHVV